MKPVESKNGIRGEARINDLTAHPGDDPDPLVTVRQTGTIIGPPNRRVEMGGPTSGRLQVALTR